VRFPAATPAATFPVSGREVVEIGVVGGKRLLGGNAHQANCGGYGEFASVHEVSSLEMR
jgi:hypothetical protein